MDDFKIIKKNIITQTRPKKRFSQNFLHDPNIARKITDACVIKPEDVVTEIGCGQGFLTERLLEKASVVHGVEVDKGLISELNIKFGNDSKFRLHPVDVLELDFSVFLQDQSGTKIKLAGNLPYHITTPILFKCLDYWAMIETAVFMIQKEVAQRITAKPNTKTYGILSVICQYHADCRLLFDVSPNAFYPKPEVTSSVIRLTFRPVEIEPESNRWFKTVVRKSFNQRRKMLRNSLSEILPDRTIDFNLERRPESLTVEEFMALSRMIPLQEKK